VSLDGKSLSAGVIRFVPLGETHGPAASTEIRDGKYAFSKEDGPVAGEHRIEIEATEYFGFAIDDEAAFAAKVHQPGGRLPKNPVPAAYNRQSRLRANVSLDRLKENFELTTSAPRTAN
jgi:hypothetical protein